MARTAWTDLEIKRLRELARVHSYDDLCRLLKKPKNSIRWKVRQQGLKTKHPNSLPYPQMKRIFNFSAEFGIKQTMAKYGMTVDQVKGLRIRYRKINKKHIENIDLENITALRKKCFIFGTRKGLSHERCQDFASYAVIKKIELGHVFMTINNIYRNWYYLKDIHSDQLNCEYKDAILHDKANIKDKATGDFKVLIEHLDYLGRSIFLLSLVYNITFEDIGFCLNIKKEAVSYYYNKILLKLKKNQKIKDFVNGRGLI